MTEEYTEEAAARLGEEIQRLEALLARMTPILKMILRREWFKKEMKAFEAAASDPTRLFRVRTTGNSTVQVSLRRAVG